jgi:cytochrome c2
VATVTFPSAGTWEWVINDGFVTADALGFRGQPMPALSVLTSTGAAVSSPSPAPPLSLAPLVIALGVAGAGAGLIAVVRTRASWAAALTLASLMLVVLGFMASGSTATASTVPQSASRPPEVEHGQALFLAKGCVICHAHASVSEARRTFGDWRIGPDLSKLSAKPEYLQAWLKDPRAVKPATEMPDLKLKPAEIDALAAFLTQGQ